jgi:hypothetical protein
MKKKICLFFIRHPSSFLLIFTAPPPLSLVSLEPVNFASVSLLSLASFTLFRFASGFVAGSTGHATQ